MKNLVSPAWKFEVRKPGTVSKKHIATTRPEEGGSIYLRNFSPTCQTTTDDQCALGLRFVTLSDSNFSYKT